MQSALDDVEFLAGSSNRLDVLDAIRNGILIGMYDRFSGVTCNVYEE